MGLKVFKDLDALSTQAACFFKDLSQRAILEKGSFTVALSGGGTPKRLYELLATDEFAKSIDWRGVHLFWADERCAPFMHAEGNFRPVFDLLISKVPLPSENIHRIMGEKGAGEGALLYEKKLREFFKEGPPCLDLAILGMGRDGHTASIMPGSDALLERQRYVSPVYMHGKGSFDRITLTLPALNNAKEVLFLVADPQKGETLGYILNGRGGDKYPAGLVANRAGGVTWFVDERTYREAKQVGLKRGNGHWNGFC